MDSERLFQATLLISLVTHGVILFANPHLNFFSSAKKEQKTEITYVKAPEKEKSEPKPQKQVSRKEPFLKLSSKITLSKKIPPPFVDKESIFKNNGSAIRQDLAFAKPAFIKPDVIAIKKKITLPPIDIDRINNPSYISYYQIVREKIKRAAYQNYTGKEIGEVTLSFIISSDGCLKNLRLREEKSAPSAYLREIALRSVRDASLFPAFPKELDYPQLSFNLGITFEIE